MRLPLATDLKARVGTPDKDARVKNGIVEIRGESSLVRQRPGVSEASATALGLLAQGGMAFGDYLVIINGDDAFYFDDFFALLGGYNLITESPFIVYASDVAYDLGDIVYYQDPDTGEISAWYPYTTNPTEPPSGSSPQWSQTPPPATRFYVEFGGPSSATKDAAVSAWFPIFYAGVEQSCPGSAPYYIWYDSTVSYVGTSVYGNQYGTAGTRTCGDPLNGPYTVSIGTIHQTA